MVIVLGVDGRYAFSVMPVDVKIETLIDRPVAQLATYTNDPDNVPTWHVDIKTMEWQTEPPVALGSKCAFVAHFLGNRKAYVYEVVEYDPLGGLTMRTAEGPFPMETTYAYQSIGPTPPRVRWRNRGEPAGFLKLVAPFMALAMRRANNKDLALLKQTIEALPPDAS